jgi:predicted metal-dependent phosphoesterase TrpH
VIDLHTHTTASDGRCTPPELVERARANGVRVLGVTDHDTIAGCAPAREVCARHGIEFVPGIEVTAVVGEADVHVLGYFVDIDSRSLHEFLARARQQRVQRIRDMVARLATHGIGLDADEILRPGLTDNTKAIGRPYIARALIKAGHVATVSEAFDRWLSPGQPAFVPRIGASPEEVFGHIHAAGGIASLAHPILTDRDDRIPGYVDAGLDAIEVYHSDHDAAATQRYLTIARRFNLAITGGSDYHADDEHGGGGPGSVTLPADDYARLVGLRAARRATASGPSTSS